MTSENLSGSIPPIKYEIPEKVNPCGHLKSCRPLRPAFLAILSWKLWQVIYVSQISNPAFSNRKCRVTATSTGHTLTVPLATLLIGRRGLW